MTPTEQKLSHAVQQYALAMAVAKQDQSTWHYGEKLALMPLLDQYTFNMYEELDAMHPPEQTNDDWSRAFVISMKCYVRLEVFKSHTGSNAWSFFTFVDDKLVSEDHKLQTKAAAIAACKDSIKDLYPVPLKPVPKINLN